MFQYEYLFLQAISDCLYEWVIRYNWKNKEGHNCHIRRKMCWL